MAGNFKGRRIGVNPTTGADTGFFALGLADPLPGAWGGIAVYRIAINPAGTRLVATGNFQTVAGQSRTRFFMADIAGASAVLDPWYYPGFAKRCSATHARRIAYLQGVDFSPDGSYSVVTATRQIPSAQSAIWPAGSAQYHTLFGAGGSFNMNDDQHPAWINYTGGDSIWVAAATGPAVYVQGHFQWLDNPNGFASRDGGGAVRREGIGAIDPETGNALPWNPLKPTQIGGKTLLVTPDGLWIGSDSVKFDGIARRGLAFTPLPLTMIGAGDIATCGSTDDELTAAIVSATEAIPFTVGDNAYDAGTATQFTDCYGPSWGAFASQTRPAPGERDYLTTNAAAYFGYFGAAAGEPTQGYYSYNVGAWHVVVLNSMCERVGGCGATAPMVTWLKADLAANPTKCTLAYFHHPLFSSGLTAGNTKMRPVWNALYAAKADVVVNAHDTHYERFARQQADGVPNEVRGIRQFVVGTGGAPLAGFGTVQPNSEVRNADSFGVLKLRLHPSSYEWSFVPAEGSTFTDSGTTDCY